MFLFRVRRLAHLLLVAGMIALGWQETARAGANDLELLNLCPVGQTTPAGVQQLECEWIQRDGSGVITSPVTPSDAAKSAFRSLMSELGVVAAPRLMTPADTL